MTRQQTANRDDLIGNLVATSKETLEHSISGLEHEADRLRAEVERLHETGITLPLVAWRLPVPPPELLTFYGGLAALAAIDLVDWPLAVVIAIGHELARSRRPGMRGLGESVESA